MSDQTVDEGRLHTIAVEVRKVGGTVGAHRQPHPLASQNPCLHKKRVEQAGFAVLKSPDIPSLLIETGFISNPEEARRLGNRKFRQRLAAALSHGIDAYFNNNPPPDSLLAKLKRELPREHVIARGDTLSGIALHYRVSVVSIRQTNGLSGSKIRTGQRLLIPHS